MKMAFEREIKVIPGHDCMRFDCIHGSPTCHPRTGGSHGLGGADIHFYLKGEKGAISFVLSPPWFPMADDSHEERQIQKSLQGAPPLAYPIEIHWRTPDANTPSYEQPPKPNCPLLGGEPCYHASWAMTSGDACMYILFTHGTDGLWEYLEGCYDLCAGNRAESPPLPECPLTLRKA